MKWYKLLNNAWKSFSTKKKINGEYNLPYIKSFAENYKTKLDVIEQHLNRRDYKFGKWKATFIPKKDGGKRPLIIPQSINDKLVLKAISEYLSNVLSNIFNSVSSISYAYQKGKSSRDALIQLKRIHNPQNILLKIDIKHFFDEIDKTILIQLLNEHPIDAYVKDLISKGLNPIIDYSALDKSDIEKFPQGGIPQGNPISAILSNLYLYELDKLSISNGWKMVRYADDMVFSVSNFEEAKLILSQVEKYLLDKRKLRIHPFSDSSNEKTNIYKNPKKQRMKYLGVIFDGKNLYPTDERCSLLIDKIKTILSSKTTCEEIDKEIKKTIAQWCGYYAFTDITNRQLKMMNNAISHHISKCKLNISDINIIDVVLKTRKRQNSLFCRLFYPLRFGEEYEWLNFYK